ncbi:MAG: 3-oxoadipate enol-lactonase [Actinobacteria bacterium]|nr:3-oxoadipate enol-lactonase [Actinomycetota bacterium]
MKRIDVAGVGIAYRVDGHPTEPPVVLLHSAGCDLRMWDLHIAALGERFSLVRADARGHGGSDAPPPPYTVDRFGADAIAVLDALQIERAHIVGESLGGLVALWIAVHHPGRVERAVFSGTAARIGTAETWQERADAVRAGGTEAVADLVMSRFFSPAFRRDHADVVGWFTGVLRAQPAHGYEATCLALRDADLRDEVGAIVAPSLILVGDQDEATPVSDASWLHEMVDGSRLRTLEGAGHLCSVERRATFDEIVARFLRGEEIT